MQHSYMAQSERIMKRFKSAGQVQRFLSVRNQVANLFRRPANIYAQNVAMPALGPFGLGLR
jgi:putative transposase